MLGIARYCYNQTVAVLKDGSVKASWTGLKTDIIKGLPDWAAEAPYQVRSIAIKDACKAVSNAKLKYKTTSKYNTVKFRSKKDSKQSLYLPKSAVSTKGIFVRLLGKDIRPAEQLPDPEYDGRVVYEYGKWWVVLPVDITVEIPKTKEKIVSLDPGIRTFMTYFGFNSAGFIATDGWRRLLSYCHELDKISQCSKVTAARRQNLKRAANRLRFRIKNLRDELHWKTAVWLCKNFEAIIIPALPAGKLSRRHTRKLRSKTVRSMLTLGHSMFLQRLKYCAEKYRSVVIVSSEAYTSKTCTVCGHVHEKIGGASVYRCPKCGVVISRDINGARNIMLRAMVDQPA